MNNMAESLPPIVKKSFREALLEDGISFICEVKKASPSKGVIAPNLPYIQIAKEAKGLCAVRRRICEKHERCNLKLDGMNWCNTKRSKISVCGFHCRIPKQFRSMAVGTDNHFY